ncbi:type II toxin-antitoxin system RelE/ParE family toxin [Pannonibacter phragmitetus]|uniref:type II toxin-antitoxin system RelE/ParE family toxin n=1 Tax=Pannonibacter phragmitetus TaxID=121719 RepID=UPI000F456EC3|nr:type II toxin-antitoxin system RelE/ParE family toxin [Pannonibacter phragmitetus]MBA4203458.1 plasmid stabilization protein [Polymorphum sp.]
MPQVIFAPTAIRDLQRLRAFLQEKNPTAAQRAGEAIRQGLKIVGAQPRIGRPVEGLPEQFREWLIDFGDSGYTARYHFDGETVIILAIRHQREAGYS